VDQSSPLELYVKSRIKGKYEISKSWMHHLLRKVIWLACWLVIGSLGGGNTDIFMHHSIEKITLL